MNRACMASMYMYIIDSINKDDRKCNVGAAICTSYYLSAIIGKALLLEDLKRKASLVHHAAW